MSFEFPAELPQDTDELRDIRSQAIDTFDEVADGEPSDESLATMERLADGIEQIDAKLTEIGEAAREREEKADALKDRIRRTEESVADKAAAESDDEDAEGDGDDEAPERDDDAEPEDRDGEGDKPVGDEAVEQDRDREPLAASARRRVGGRGRSNTKQAPKPVSPLHLTTNVANYTADAVDLDRVAAEFSRMAHSGQGRMVGSNGYARTPLATVKRAIPEEFSVSSDRDAYSVVERATDEKRLKGGSLVAAGGWNAPSETSYSFLPIRPAEGVFQLPEVGAPRGGIRFPKEPDFGELYAEVGFRQTEAEAQADKEKPFYEIPDAGFDEVRLDAVGVALTAGILQDKAWPELTQKYVGEALRAHQYKLSSYKLEKVIAGSTKTVATTHPGATGSIVDAIKLQAADIRSRHHIPRSESLEGVAPAWILDAVRADLAYRQGTIAENLTDDQILGFLRGLGVNLQLVFGWQNSIVGGETPAGGWPETVDVILYPAGTWYAAVEDVINLGVIHDQSLLKVNKQIQLFTEDGVGVGKRGPESRLVSIPLTVNGAVGPRNYRGSAPTEPAGPSATEPAGPSLGGGEA